MQEEFRWRTKSAITLAVFAVGALVLGEWLGEGAPNNPTGTLVKALGVALVLVIITPAIVGGVKIVDRQPIRSRVWASAALVLVLALATGCWSGNRIARHALSDCRIRGEAVRQALADFRTANGRFPASLSEVHSFSAPGNRLLRGSVLSYRSDGSTYRMEFGDWLVSNIATEEQPFLAGK